MQPHTGAAITLITHLWPNVCVPIDQLKHRQFEIQTQYHRRSKIHSIYIENTNPREQEIVVRIGKDWPCHLKLRLNPTREEVKVVEHSHGSTQEEFRLFLPRRLEGEYRSEPIRGFTTRHIITGDVIDSERTQVRFADVFEGDEEDPRRRYNYQYECKILAKY